MYDHTRLRFLGLVLVCFLSRFRMGTPTLTTAAIGSTVNPAQEVETHGRVIEQHGLRLTKREGKIKSLKKTAQKRDTTPAR